jgi:ubiquinone/menaquinone biosynthesis C-methylase UbiE
MSGPTNPALAYHEYLGPAIFHPMTKLTLWAAKVKPGDRALDVACGTGIVTTQLPPLVGAKGKVVGLDINPAMLSVAASQTLPEAGPGIDWVQGTGVALQFPEAAFDLVICQHGLQFFPDREAGVREMRRVLAAGGRAVVSCWKGLDHQTFFATLMRSIARHLNVTEAEAAAPFTLGDADVLRGLLDDAGFSKIDMQSHTVDARFPQPEKFVRMSASAGAAVMPDVYDGVDIEALVQKVIVDCKPDFDRYREGDLLRFPMPTNLAVAYV